MCGIARFSNINKRLQRRDTELTSNSLVNTSPASGGNEFNKYSKYNIGFGYRGLSIIDTSVRPNQPKSYNNSVKLANIPYCYEEPFGDSLAIQTTFTSHFPKEKS